MININIEKAKEIHKEKLRISRKPILEQLDVQFMRNLEQGLPVTEIGEQKQILRDITQTSDIINAQTVDDLKNSWPTDLLGESPYTNQN